MNKRVFTPLALVIIFFGSALPLFCQPLTVEFTVSRPLCVLYLIESLRGEPHHTSHLRHLFMDRRGIDKDDRKYIEDYSSLLKDMEGLVHSERDGGKDQSCSDLLEVLAVNSSSVEEFVRHSRVILPAREHKKLREIMSHFEPLYDDLFWKEGGAEIEQQLKALREEAEKIDLNGVVTRVADMLGSSWPREEAFLIAFVPVPRKKGDHFTSFAHSQGFLQVVEAPQGASLGHGLGVIVHEICHTLWFTRSEASKEELKQWFLEVKGYQAYQELNEALATATGNGWAANLPGGKGLADQWYNDDYVDSYSKGIYTLVNEYCRKGRLLDREFAHEASAIFQKRFPRADRDPRFFMRELLILSDEKQAHGEKFRFSLARHVPVHSIYSTPLEGAQSRKAYLEKDSVNALFMITPAQVTILKNYGFPENLLERLKKSLRPGEPLLLSGGTKARHVYFCVGATFEEQQKALESLFETQKE